ncbi:hypothetical protein ACH4UV_34015 [Streptomyces sp. NPDC020802]|uniref:hypothetical protein n=1 Tax=Streptomyces sp. NPDC020802 TaxID=3365094 RepID=UPI00379DB292
MERTGRAYGELMYLVLAWDVSRCAGPGGLRLTWRGDTGWSHTDTARREHEVTTDTSIGRIAGDLIIWLAARDFPGQPSRQTSPF